MSDSTLGWVCAPRSGSSSRPEVAWTRRGCREVGKRCDYVDSRRERCEVWRIWKRGQLGRTAVISNGMVWFGLALFVGAFAAQLLPTALAGEWYSMLGWLMLVCAAAALVLSV